MVVHGERYIDCCWYMVELEEKEEIVARTN